MSVDLDALEKEWDAAQPKGSLSKAAGILHGRSALTAAYPALAAEIRQLREELALWKPPTPEEAERLYADAEAEPMSEEQIQGILDRITDPAYTPTNCEHAQLAAKLNAVRADRDRLAAQVQAAASEREAIAARIEEKIGVLIASGPYGDASMVFAVKRQIAILQELAAEVRGRGNG